MEYQFKLSFLFQSPLHLLDQDIIDVPHQAKLVVKHIQGHQNVRDVLLEGLPDVIVNAG